MWTFVFTVAATVLIYLLFAGFERWGVQSNWAITINYYVLDLYFWHNHLYHLDHDYHLLICLPQH